jgi:hypothetical protein
MVECRRRLFMGVPYRRNEKGRITPALWFE